MPVHCLPTIRDAAQGNNSEVRDSYTLSGPMSTRKTPEGPPAGHFRTPGIPEVPKSPTHPSEGYAGQRGPRARCSTARHRAAFARARWGTLYTEAGRPASIGASGRPGRPRTSLQRYATPSCPRESPGRAWEGRLQAGRRILGRPDLGRRLPVRLGQGREAEVASRLYRLTPIRPGHWSTRAATPAGGDSHLAA